MPRVTIGLPVYNGENFIADALESALGQTYRDFELIISDNASEDATEEICRRYAEKDSRVQYSRCEENIGASPNFNRVVDLAQGEYFRWAAHDDVCEPTFLEKCVEVLDRDPEVVLVHSLVRIIDDNGDPVRSYENPLSQCDADEPHVRFEELMRGLHACFEVFGLMRTEALRKTERIGSFISSDRNLLAELGLMGKYHEIPEELFLSRDHQSRSIRAMKVHARANWFDTSRPKKRIVLPYWRQHFEAYRSIRRVPLPFRSRRKAYFSLLKTVLRRWRFFRGDVLRAIRTLITRR